ncbi:MAG: cadherin-like beta sandwich domain-containing protein, partial [Oscillospiraceae bacterium]|nr:cadherin-like beta sandwich domain-containing protein [Oscillospiraceae bacterium]
MTRAIHPFAKAAISLVICLLLVISCLLPAHAASCYISLSASDGKVGDTVGLSVYASGDIAAATITISYDTTILQYAGGDGSDNYGSVTFDGEHSSGGGDLSFYASFTAIASGQANFSVVGYDVVDSGANNMDVSYDSSYSAISAPSTASSDSSLASLSVGSGSLSPAFSSGTTEYSLYVGYDTDYLSISASPNDGGAYVYVSDQNLAEGDNAIYVTVTAEDGVSSTTYSIYVYREYADGAENRDDEDEDEDTEDGVAYADLTDGRQMEIIDFDDEDLPNGFTRSTLKFDGVTVPVGVNAASGQYIVWLSDEDADDTFWLFDAASGIAQPISWLPESATQYLILSLPAEELPEGYKTVSAKIGGVDVQVLSAADAPSVNHYIVYAMNSSGNTGFYLYDIDEGTFQRYNFAVLAEVQPSPSPSPTPLPTLDPNIDYRKYGDDVHRLRTRIEEEMELLEEMVGRYGFT